MPYLDIKTNFQSILNRRDITPSQVILFLNNGLQRIQRELRIPAIEKVSTFTTDGTPNVSVPTDLGALIGMSFNDAVNRVVLKRVDLMDAIIGSSIPGTPRMFARQGSSYLLAPYPPAGTTGTLAYYATIPRLSADTDTNWLSENAPDLWMYAALGYACDYFMDERLNNFESRYQQILGSLQDQALEDELSGATILPVGGLQEPYP